MQKQLDVWRESPTVEQQLHNALPTASLGLIPNMYGVGPSSHSFPNYPMSAGSSPRVGVGGGAGGGGAGGGFGMMDGSGPSSANAMAELQHAKGGQGKGAKQGKGKKARTGGNKQAKANMHMSPQLMSNPGQAIAIPNMPGQSMAAQQLEKSLSGGGGARRRATSKDSKDIQLGVSSAVAASAANAATGEWNARERNVTIVTEGL